MAAKNKLESFIKNPRISLWKLTIPMMFGLFVNSIYILVDTYFVGSMLGEDGTSALSALGYVMPFYFIIMGITFGISSGTTAVIAQYIGENNHSSSSQTAQNSLVIAVLVSIINIFFTYWFASDAIEFQGANSKVLSLALEYFYIMAYGSVFLIFGIFLRGILIGEGESIVPMIALGTGTILNIILDPFFIKQYGISGAAYATMVSHIVVIFIFLYFIFIKKITYSNLNFKNFNFNFEIWKKIFKLGIPSSISMLIMSCGLFIMNTILVDDAHVAGYNLANRIENFATLALISLASSQVTIIGMFYGAKKYHLIKPMIRYATVWAMIIGGLFSILSLLFIDKIAPLFFPSNSTLDLAMKDDAIKSTIQYYNYMAFAYPFIGLTMVSSRALQAISIAWPMILITFTRVIILQCSLTYLFIVVLGYKDVAWAWYAISVSCIFAGIIAYLMRLYFVNKLKEI